jgi:hypothetical protein
VPRPTKPPPLARPRPAGTTRVHAMICA